MFRSRLPWAIGAAGVVLVAASVAAVFAAEDERGERAERGEKKVPLDSLPAVVRDAIVREAGKGTIDDIAELTRDGKTVYEFDVVEDGRETEIHVGADGLLIHRKDEGTKRGSSLAKGGKAGGAEFTRDFRLEGCTFAATGRNAFFVLEPGYQLSLEHREGNESEQLVVTVLDETEKVGNVETRVVEERETENGELKEVSRNYFAFCKETGSVYYFGERTTKYTHGQPGIANDSWRADGEGCRPGLAMPGLALLGARYYQEFAPDTALDRAEIVGVDATLQTPAGTFDHCLVVEETNPLEPGERDVKIFAPGIGLVQDEDLLLTKHGAAAK